MFWRFGAHVNAPNIDSLLDNANITLEEVLDQNDLLQELKQQNVKIIGFLSRTSTIERLLEYVVAPKLEVVGDGNPEQGHTRTGSQTQGSEEKPGEEDSEKRLNRYAYISTEILSSDTRQICDSLMRNHRLMAKFWTFLKLSPPLDPLQASYFTRVNENLLERSTQEMLTFFKSLEGVVQKMLVHVDSPMIMDLLLKIISLEKSEGGQGIVDWLQSQGLIEILISFLSSEHTWATQTSAGDFLKAIITISANTSQNQQSCVGPNELTRQLVSRPCVEELITYMLEGGNPLTVGVGIVIEVIRKNNSDYDPLFNAELYTPSTRDPIFLGTLLRLFAQRVPDFMNLMLSPNQNSTSKNWPPGTRRTQLNAAFGEKIEPLGFDRFKVCELMAEILHCSNMGLLNEPDSEELIRKRDAERERLKNEGKLGIFPEDSNTLTPKRDDAKKLQVHNVSDDDGFERVSHSVDDDVTDFYNSEPINLMDKDDEEYVEPLSPKIIMEEPTSERGTASLSPVRKISRKLDTLGLENASHEQIGYQITEQLFTLENELSTATLEEHPFGKDSTSRMDVNLSNEVSQTSDSLSQNFGTALFPQQQVPEVPKLPSNITKSESNVMEYSNYKPAPLSVVKTNTPDSKLETHCLSEESSLTGVDSVMEECGGQSSQIINVCMNILDYPIVGDFLKIQFVKYKVVPTILDFFFRFPWNNFLHNVVYDIVQQVFNGPMERGFNRSLAFDLFETGDITMKIVNGQKKSDEMIKLRLGYMGHLTLIAEEVVKFTARHPSQLFPNSVLEKVMNPEWITYVEVILTETRERDNAILGGVRPVKTVIQRQMGANIVGNFGTALADTGLTGFETGSGEDDNMVGVEQATEPPPPKWVALPLSIPPNRRRRQLASKLALQKQEQENSTSDDQDNEISVTTRAKKRLSLDDNELD